VTFFNISLFLIFSYCACRADYQVVTYSSGAVANSRSVICLFFVCEKCSLKLVYIFLIVIASLQAILFELYAIFLSTSFPLSLYEICRMSSVIFLCSSLFSFSIVSLSIFASSASILIQSSASGFII